MSQPENIKKYLEKIGINFKTHRHLPVYTCEEAEKLCRGIKGIHSKNLLLKSKKTDNFYLAIIEHSKRLDIKAIGQKLGEKISFASDNDLMENLNIQPGSVSPFALINDKEGKIMILLDKDVNESEIVSFHPNINTETLELSGKDFHRYLESLKNKVVII